MEATLYADLEVLVIPYIANIQPNAYFFGGEDCTGADPVMVFSFLVDCLLR